MPVMRALKSLEVIAAIETTIRQGSPLKAARTLGCAPSTIYRAVDRIEYAETGARYEYMDLVAGGPAEGLTDEETKSIVDAFGVDTTLV